MQHEGRRERAIFSALHRPQPGTIEGRARCRDKAAVPTLLGTSPELGFYFKDDHSDGSKAVSVESIERKHLLFISESIVNNLKYQYASRH